MGIIRKVLVIDDDVLLVRLMEHHLIEEGFEVIKAYNGREGLSLVRSLKPDLVTLDIVLPDISGWEVCQLIRQVSKVPIVMLTVKEEEEDVVRALEYGADDYIAKPVGMKELVARIQAILRREEFHESPKGWVGFSDEFLQVDLAQQRVLRQGSEVRLTPTELNLLSYLVTNAGRTIKPRELLVEVWGQEYADDFDFVRTYIWQLRRKLEPDPKNPKYILNRPGFGYCFERRQQQA